MMAAPPEVKWQQAIELCREILADRAGFEEREVAFKHKVAARVIVAVEAARDGGDLSQVVKQVFASPNSLLFHLDATRFKEWARDDEDAARRALIALAQPGTAADRVDAFSAAVPAAVLQSPGARIGCASMFLMGLDPPRYPVYRAGAIKGAERLLGWEQTPADSSLGEEYEHHMAFVAHFGDRLREAGLEVRDMLDAQSLIWILMKWGQPQFMAWREQKPPQKPSPPVEVTPPDAEASTFEELASELYVDAPFLQEVVELLEEKRQLIFYGPPGTGKTYIARRLARFLTGDDSQRTEIVQFHPSYSYEDFVQGYRPRPDDSGNLSYELVDGPLMRLAQRARQSPHVRHILLVDEINRGNLPRIFGELLYLLEYRDDEIALTYSRGESLFSLPRNLWVIGTMNTADRSIGLIDAALRRRFHFKALFPGRPPLAGLLEKWLDDKAPAMSPVAAYVDQLNHLLRERFGDHLQVGHSYFMVKGLDESRLERIWEVDILPFLEDQLFGKEGELDRFRLPAIMRQAEGTEEDAPVRDLTDANDQPQRIPAEG